MKNKLTPFDRLIQQKMEDLEAPFQENHWEQMEEQLAEDATDEKFDRAAADRLRPMETPYDARHWDLMAQKIDYAFSFRHWLHRNHVPELVLMILLGFTIFQYWRSGERPATFAPPPAPVPAAAACPVIIAGLCEPSQAPSAAQPSQAYTLSAPVAEEVLPIASLQSELSTALLETAPPPIAPFDGLPGLALASLQQAPLAQAPTSAAPTVALAKIPVRWYVGAYGAADYNVISAPTDKLFQLPGYRTDSTGLRAGVFVAAQNGKWGLQTGLSFARVAYRPLLPEQQYGTFDYLVVESFEQIRYDFLQIPLRLRRSLLPDGSHWNLYALGGLEANLILTAQYDINKQEIVSERAMAMPAPEAIAEQSILGKKQYPEGVLNGDPFLQNTYLSFSLGFGLERTLFSRYALFAEPVYARSLFGHEIGPNNDRIHQFSLRAGLKVRVTN
jgi:hypothetical protein